MNVSLSCSTNSTFSIDYLGRKITTFPSLVWSPYSEMEKVEIGILALDPRKFADLRLRTNRIEFRYLDILKAKLDNGFCEQTLAQCVCLEEIHHQRQRAMLDIPSDVPYAVDPEGRWFIRIRTHRFSAVQLKPSEITETHIADVARLFFMEIVYNLNLLGPENIEGWEEQRFQVVGPHVIMGLPLCNLQYGVISEARHRKLLIQFNKVYPKELFRDVEKKITEAKSVRILNDNALRENLPPSNRVLVLNTPLRDPRVNFYETCGSIFEQTLKELTFENKKFLEPFEIHLQNLFFSELHGHMAYRYKEEGSRRICTRTILKELKIYLNDRFGTRFSSKVFEHPYHFFYEVFLKDLIYPNFLKERLIIIDYYDRDELEWKNNRLSQIFYDVMFNQSS